MRVLKLDTSTLVYGIRLHFNGGDERDAELCTDALAPCVRRHLEVEDVRELLDLISSWSQERTNGRMIGQEADAVPNAG